MSKPTECANPGCVIRRSNPRYIPLNQATNTILWVPTDMNEALGPYLLRDLIGIVQSYTDPIDRIQTSFCLSGTNRWVSELMSPITMTWTNVDIYQNAFGKLVIQRVWNNSSATSQTTVIEDLLCAYMLRHGVPLWGSQKNIHDVCRALDFVFDRNDNGDWIICCSQNVNHSPPLDQFNCSVDVDLVVDSLWVIPQFGPTPTRWGFNLVLLCARPCLTVA